MSHTGPAARWDLTDPDIPGTGTPEPGGLPFGWVQAALEAFVNGDVWTGTFSSGEATPAPSCDEFRSGSPDDMALCGSATAVDTRWSENLLPDCDLELHVYCFEQ